MMIHARPLRTGADHTPSTRMPPSVPAHVMAGHFRLQARAGVEGVALVGIGPTAWTTPQR